MTTLSWTYGASRFCAVDPGDAVKLVYMRAAMADAFDVFGDAESPAQPADAVVKSPAQPADAFDVFGEGPAQPAKRPLLPRASAHPHFAHAVWPGGMHLSRARVMLHEASPHLATLLPLLAKSLPRTP